MMSTEVLEFAKKNQEGVDRIVFDCDQCGELNRF